MQQCPKCGSGVPDGRTTCHICFAELGADAQASGPAGLNFATPQSAAVTPQPTTGAGPLTGEPAAIPVPPPPTRAGGIPGLQNPPQPPAAQSLPGLPGIYAPQEDVSAAQPNYLRGDASAMAPQSGMAGGEVRVSLTGEVIQAPPVTPQLPRSVGQPPSGPGRATGPSMPARRPAPVRAAARDERPAEKSGGSAVWLAVLLVLVLAGGGFGGWYWYNNRTNPKDQAVKALTAFKNMDWAALHSLIAFSEADKAKYPTPAAFADAQNQQMDKAGPLKDLIKTALGGMSDISAGEPTFDGDKAKVPVSLKLNVMGQSFPVNQTLTMVKEGGIWKIDASSSGSGAGVSIAGIIGSFMQGTGMPGMSGSRQGDTGGGASGGHRRSRRSRR